MTTTASPSFIEQRRKALRRFLLMIRRHPVLRDDEIVRYFFSFNGAEVAQHIKERYKVVVDESMTSELVKTARVSCEEYYVESMSCNIIH